MSPPLSPLSSSNQNVRARSPATTPSGSTARRRGIDEIMAADNPKENISEVPAKRALFERKHDSEEAMYPTAYEVPYTGTDDATSEGSVEQPPSSPFLYDVKESTANLEQNPTERRKSNEITHGDAASTEWVHENNENEDTQPNQEQTPAKENTMDVKYDKNNDNRRGAEKPAIEIFVDEDVRDAEHQDFRDSGRREMDSTTIEDRRNEGMSTVCQGDSDEKADMDCDVENDATNDVHRDPMDDTCLSTFSAVPNADMTLFAKLRRESPTKTMRDILGSPSRRRDSQCQSVEQTTPGTVKRNPRRSTALFDVTSPVASPTPRKRDARNEDDTTNLLDFTDQLNFFPRNAPRYSMQNEHSSPSRRYTQRSRQSIRSPGKFNLLDFDIPPAPTPRSIPTITPRELETVKSGFLSEISSLKASLSGKEAEVSSLKQAIADAERRVGEALEEARNEAARKEALEIEQAEWERRGKEMETILRGIKAQIVEGERERDLLMKKLEEAEKNKEHLEGRIVELEGQLSAARDAANAGSGKNPSNNDSRNMKTAEEAAREVQDAVERVARELHTLYKSKHETKVAALKKSYEARWEKRVREAENKLREAVEENERLKTERDATMSGPVNPDASLIAREKDEHEAEKRVLEAQIKGLQEEMATLKRDNERLHSELKVERAEKGELVAAVDEWLAMQQQSPQQQQQKIEEPPTPRYPSSQESTKSVEPEPEDFRRSISRPGTSGIKPPTAGLSSAKAGRFGMPGNGHSRGNSGSRSSIAAPTPSRSGIMGSIERMGRGGS
ncbi:hypothetical protein VTN00DRAFT_300 [Thermoascus crustaceus]|uniref:uncharacterized protein n=1 Tax=Thermoascus crustaceus TaxID=5088 RepID=UPI003742B384